MYKRDRINTIFEDYIIFRELNPIKKELPKFEEIKRKLKLNFLPRKKDFEYAKVLSLLFKEMGDFKKVIYFGDTYLNDGGVIKNLTRLGEYEVFGVITEEKEQDQIKIKDNIIINTKWRNLFPILDILGRKGFSFDEETIVIIDIDKTFIGARGRNNKAIDKARMDAIISIVNDVFNELDIDRFEYVYSRLNRKSLHPFTGDNQDIVAILSIIFYGDYYGLGRFLREVYEGKWKEPLEFINRVEVPKEDKVFEFVEEVRGNLIRKNPTAFSSFRKREFEYTIKRMDFLPDNENIYKLLNEEIMITREVYEIGLLAKEKGSLVFGLSDKPELSSISEKESIYSKTAKIFPK